MATTAGKIIAFIVVQIILIAGACWAGWHQSNQAWQNRWLQRDATDLQSQLKNAADNAAQEHDWSRQYAALDADFQRKLRAVNTDAERIIDNYRRGNLRLRASLNCAARNMPDVATPSGVSDAAARCGFSGADVEFLIRYAGKSQATAEQLAAAQALLKIIYAKHPDLRQ